jgi:hypothetical protein
MKHCIVNFANDYFVKGQDRLVQSLQENNYQGDIITFNHYEQVGSKTHQQVPYQFKVYAIEKARQMGYDIVLYCDASMFAIKDVMPVIHHIIEKGHVLENCGFSAGQWATDLCLNEFGISREEAFDISLYSAGFTGLNFQNKDSKLFFEKWLYFASQEITFIGDWNNNNKQCSQDERCLGHRHDQTVASILSHILGLDKILPTYMQYIYTGTEIKEETIFGCQGII